MKKFYTLLLLALFCGTIQAQPVITSAFNPVPGDMYKYHPINTLIAPGPAGPNVTWDFSGIHVVYNPSFSSYIYPSSTPYSNDFPGTNVALEELSTPGTYHFYETTSSKWEKKGYASVLLTAVYSDPHTMFTYPFTYNTKVTDNYSCTTAVTITMDLYKTGKWEAEGDAYGTLMLPSGTHSNILRILVQHEYTDEYVGVSTYEYEVIEYWWVSATSKKPLLKISTTYYAVNSTPIDTIEQIIISDEVHQGIAHPDQNLSNIRIYPNPSSGDLMLDIDLQQGSLVEVDLLNAEGRRVKAYGMMDLMAGQHQEMFTLQDVAPGLYFLQVKSGGVSRMVKVVRM